ncbi:MAG: rhomboid family intramembrane serine protease [Bacteroidetes bacterium]|nr:rhomboid family intramembrane serine protease [Bacteroidota bacterium]MCB0843524.1 rhomboid family intramembrane serine protease [Bacteroidota bacterium]MCB0854577.1 rhomboid family intramembrane serine protease [Bacteroidota bacterium]
MQITPVVKNIIILNVFIFLLLFLPLGLLDQFGEYLVMFKSNALGFRGENFRDYFKPIQIVTGFLTHIEPFHLIFNMLALYFIGVPVEQSIGSSRFAKFYLFCGVISGIVIVFLDPTPNPVLGASTAISGILAAFGIMHPDAKISLFFLLPIKARDLFLGAAVISAVLALFQMVDSDLIEMGRVSHFGHLAGMLAGALFFYLEKYIPFLRK